jgi:hypothetical protein
VRALPLELLIKRLLPGISEALINTAADLLELQL